MYKRVMKYIKQLEYQNIYPEFTLGTLVVTVLCAFLIIMATFTQFEFGYVLIPEKIFTSPFNFFSEPEFYKEFIKNFNYIPQIPIVLFIGALMGYRFGLIAIGLYVIAGLCGLPIFGLGGGIGYLGQPSFGYILGYFAGAFFVAKNLETNRSILSIIASSIIGVITIHLIGILYIIIISIFQHQPIFSVLGWMWVLTGIQLIYDLFISIIAVTLARPIRALLWVATS